MEEWQESLEKKGLGVNAKKTEFIVCIRKGDVEADIVPLYEKVANNYRNRGLVCDKRVSCMPKAANGHQTCCNV